MVLFSVIYLYIGSCTCSEDKPTVVPPPEGIDAETFTIYDAGDHPGNPRIGHNAVIFSDKGDIYGFDLTKEEVFPVCKDDGDQEYPAISDDNIIWIDHRNGVNTYDIYGYDLSDDEEVLITSISNPTGPWRGPNIDGDIIAWEDDQEGWWDKYGYDIRGFNIAAGNEFIICNNPANQSCPKVGDNIVVWTDFRNGNGDIYGFNVSTEEEFPICTNEAYQGWADICGGIVVWEDERNGNVDIYGYNFSTGTEFPVCIEPHNQNKPMVSGDIVVWEDERHSWWEEEPNYWFYGYDISAEEEFPITGYDSISGIALQDFSNDIIVYYDMGGESWKIMGIRLP
jgi:beta propeller repeat protein